MKKLTDSSHITILLHLYQQSQHGAKKFVAMNIDDTAAISFQQDGKGEVIAQLDTGRFQSFEFQQEALPFVIKQYSQKGTRWQIRQHLLPEGLVNNHPLQRFFTFGFEGCATDIIAFAPGITTQAEAIKIMTRIPTIQTVALPCGMIDNLALMEYVNRPGPTACGR